MKTQPMATYHPSDDYMKVDIWFTKLSPIDRAIFVATMDALVNRWLYHSVDKVKQSITMAQDAFRGSASGMVMAENVHQRIVPFILENADVSIAEVLNRVGELFSPPPLPGQPQTPSRAAT